MIKNVINQILGSLGYRLISAKKTKNPVFKTDATPIFIEFLGVSGVGKSTLYQALKKEKNDWIEVREFLKMYPAAQTNTLFDGQEIYQQIARQKLKLITELPIASADKFRMIHWGYTTLIEDTLVKKHNQNATIVSEEGLLHNFGDAIFELYENENFNLNELIQNRAIIYCINSTEIIAKQIRDRADQTGRIVSHHKTKNAEELLEVIQQEMNKKQEFVDLLSKYNLPILVVDTSENIQFNIEKIKAFMQDLQAGKNKNL